MSHIPFGPMPHNEPVYEYCPAAQNLAPIDTDNIHISALRIGMHFIASGRRYRVVYRRENRAAGGKAEYDVEARCIDDGRLYLFHAPIEAPAELWTFRCC